jgi:Short C-terminal domain
MGLVRGMARTAVVAGTATAVSNRVSRRQAARWGAQEQQQYAQPAYQQPVYEAPPPAPAPAPAASGGDDISAEIQKLAAMKDQGLLTEEEFAAAKAKLLGI